MKKLIASGLLLSAMGFANAAVQCNPFPNNVMQALLTIRLWPTNKVVRLPNLHGSVGGLVHTGLGGLIIRGTVNDSVTETSAGSIQGIGANVNASIQKFDGGNISVKAYRNVGGGSVTVIAATRSFEASILENNAENVGLMIKGGVSLKN